MLTVSRVWDWGQHHQENKKLQADLTQREFTIRELTKTVEHLQARGCVILPACFPLHTADVFLFSHSDFVFHTLHLLLSRLSDYSGTSSMLSSSSSSSSTSTSLSTSPFPLEQFVLHRERIPLEEPSRCLAFCPHLPRLILTSAERVQGNSVVSCIRKVLLPPFLLLR